MIQRSDFATKALKTTEDGGFEQSRKRSTTSCRSASSMLSSSRSSTITSGAKRSAPSSGSFDMGEFLKASQQVEDTIAFPTIEWPSFDDDYDSSSSSSDDDNSYSMRSLSTRTREEREEDDDDFFQQQSPRKRQCRGLIRCDRSCNLSSLWEMAASSERHGSNGSLS